MTKKFIKKTHIYKIIKHKKNISVKTRLKILNKKSKQEKLQFENISKNLYYNKILDNTFNEYSSQILFDLIQKESEIINRIIITKEILSLYDLTNEHRKYALKFLYKIVNEYNILIECYFKTMLIFDKFLINFSKISENLEKCKNFFKVKDEKKEISIMKLLIYILCCFYIANKIYNIKSFSLKHILNINISGEKNIIIYEDLIELTDNIITYINCEIDDVDIYQFISLFLFDLNKRFQILIRKNNFIEQFKNLVIFFGIKLSQNIELLKILPSLQVLGIVIVCFKLISENYCQNEELNDFFQKWIDNLIDIIDGYDPKKLANIIDWIRNYYIRNIYKYELEK